MFTSKDNQNYADVVIFDIVLSSNIVYHRISYLIVLLPLIYLYY